MESLGVECERGGITIALDFTGLTVTTEVYEMERTPRRPVRRWPTIVHVSRTSSQRVGIGLYFNWTIQVAGGKVGQVWTSVSLVESSAIESLL